MGLKRGLRIPVFAAMYAVFKISIMLVYLTRIRTYAVLIRSTSVYRYLISLISGNMGNCRELDLRNCCCSSALQYAGTSL